MRLFKKKPRCPNCEFELDKKPSRKKKCPNCSEYIFVRRGELYTEEQVKDYDLKSKWLSWLSGFGATEETFNQERGKLSNNFGFEASVNDTIWGLMNSLQREQKDRHEIARIYTLMGKFVDEEEGKDPTPYIQQANKTREDDIKEQLNYWKTVYSTYADVRVEIYTANDDYVCEVCKRASKRKYTVDEFLETMPIPMNCISSHGCRCHIVESVK